MMQPKSSNRLSKSTIQRVLDDKELSQTLDDRVKQSGVCTSAGYQIVLRQFLSSDAVTAKVKQWEEDEAEDDDTLSTVASTAAASWLGGLTSSFATNLHFEEEVKDPHTISPLTPKISPLTTKQVMSDYGPRRNAHVRTPSRTFPILPFRQEECAQSPAFKKQFVEFLGSHPKNPFNLNLKDEAVKPKKQVPKSSRNLISLRRSSAVHAHQVAKLQTLLSNDLSLDSDSEGEVDGGAATLGLDEVDT